MILHFQQPAHIFRLKGRLLITCRKCFRLIGSLPRRKADWCPVVYGSSSSGAIWARGISHGPDEDFEKLTQVIAGVLSVARHKVRIVTPYFCRRHPDTGIESGSTPRCAGRNSMCPQRITSIFVHWAMPGSALAESRKGLPCLVMAPPFDHSKLMVLTISGRSSVQRTGIREACD